MTIYNIPRKAALAKIEALQAELAMLRGALDDKNVHFLDGLPQIPEAYIDEFLTSVEELREDIYLTFNGPIPMHWECDTAFTEIFHPQGVVRLVTFTVNEDCSKSIGTIIEYKPGTVPPREVVDACAMHTEWSE